MKNKRLTVLVLLTLLLATILVPVLSGCNNNVIVLKVYNAQDYIQHGEEESVLRDFEKYYLEKTGQKVRIQYDTFDTLERAYTIINKREADYDVMCPSDYIIEKMKKNDLLVELDKNKIPNLSNIPPYLLDRNFDRGNKYSVPYMWGTVGIMYNTDKVDEEDVKNWGLLWNDKYKNKILMKKLISWNVNGLRACVEKGFSGFFHEADADIFCLQETKLQEGQITLDLPGYYQYWNYAEKKGYSGTAIFTREEPLSVSYGLVWDSLEGIEVSDSGNHRYDN